MEVRLLAEWDEVRRRIIQQDLDFPPELATNNPSLAFVAFVSYIKDVSKEAIFFERLW